MQLTIIVRVTFQFILSFIVFSTTTAFKQTHSVVLISLNILFLLQQQHQQHQPHQPPSLQAIPQFQLLVTSSGLIPADKIENLFNVYPGLIRCDATPSAHATCTIVMFSSNTYVQNIQKVEKFRFILCVIYNIYNNSVVIIVRNLFLISSFPLINCGSLFKSFLFKSTTQNKCTLTFL